VDHIAIIGGGPIENRRALDFYPTPIDVTCSLMEFLRANEPEFKKIKTIHEPACGTGDMAKIFKVFGYEVTASDINEDTGYGTGGIDFLNEVATQREAIITNPPFNLAEKFILKSLQEAPVVGMLLKSQYWHAKSRYNLYINNPPAYILPLTWRPDFSATGGSPTMDVSWTIWIKGNTSCKYIPIGKSLIADIL
jgi:hypothetical protein